MQCIRGQAGGWSRDSMRRARASEPSYFSVNTLDLLNCTRAHVRAREARNLRRWLTPVRGAGRWIRTHLAHAHHGIAKASCPDPAVIPPIGVGACLDQCHQFVRVRVAVCLPHERSSTRPGPELERRNCCPCLAAGVCVLPRTLRSWSTILQASRCKNFQRAASRRLAASAGGAMRRR